jgi:hypothetical protein
VVDALYHAFVSALAVGLRVGAAVAFVGALVTLGLIGRRRAQPADTKPNEEQQLEAVTA